ncbi:hypothetical protein Pfo_030044 [Paulownia fortunei]|nr:hypothetical protein Pfo_030044 [Paulownia fortunei]
MAAKAFALVGEGDNYANGGSCSGESPVLSDHLHPNPSNNVTIINSLHSPQGQVSKMVRKRAASEMELHTAGNGCRFPRRTATGNGDYGACSVVNTPPNPTPQHSTQVPNYSTMPMMLPSSTNFNIIMTSGKSGSGSDTAPAFSNSYTTTAAAALTNYVDSTSSSLSSQSHQTSSTAPSVCVFSGLPLFPPDRNRGATGLQLSPATGCSSLGMEDTTAWIDGIIKDLIHTSNHVSIPQLILNVREIIHPYNPNLATLLEYRLRSLTASTDDRRRKEALPSPPCFHSASGLRLHLQADNNSLLLSQGLSAESLNDWSSPTAGNTHYLQNNNPSTLSPTTTAAALSFASPLTVFSNSDQAVSHVSQAEATQPQEQQQKSPSADPTTTATRTSPSTAPALETIRERKQEMRQQQKDEEGLHLLTLLLQCAEAVSADNLEEANRMLLEISQLATPFGTSAQRVAAYFSEAMSARIVSSCLGIYAALPTVSTARRWRPPFKSSTGSAPLSNFRISQLTRPFKKHLRGKIGCT